MPRPVKKLEKLEMVESRGLPPLKNKAKKSVSWSPQEKFSEQPPKFFQRQKSSIEEEVQAIEVQAEVKPPKKTGYTQPTPASSSSSSSSDESLSSDEHHSEVRDNFVADVSTPIPEQPNRRTSRIDSLKGLGGSRSLSRQLSSRYVDHLRDESAQANAAFQEHQERKNKRNRMADILVQDQNHADDDEAYDFFTKNWDDLGTTKHDQEDEEDGDEEDGGEEAVGNDDTKTLVKDVIGQYGYEWTITEKEVKSKRSKNADKDLCFVPSTVQAETNLKLNPNEKVRFLEEEGIYIGDPPFVPSRIQNKMENRILHEYLDGWRQGEQKRWFGQNGKLLALPNPILSHSTRPGEPEDLDPTLETVYCAPHKPGPNGEPAGTNIPGSGLNQAMPGLVHCFLEVDILTIVFHHHHLFSLEHYLASKLRERFADYQEILYRKAKLDLDRRIRVLYDAMTELKEKLEIAVQQKEREFQTRRFESYRKEVKVIREQRDEESGRERATIKEILTLWRTMRDIRRRQGYQSTNLKLTIHKENASLIDDQTQWEQELTREVDEARDDYHDNLEFLTKEYEEELRHWKQIHDMRKAAYKRHKKMKKDSEKGIGSAEVDEIAKDEELLASPEPEKPQPPGRFDEEHVRKMLEEKARQTRRPPGETILTLELSQSSNIDKDVQDNRETSRRHSLSKMKIFVKLFFNGKEVCQSSTKHIGEDFTVPIAQIFPLQITQWPETLKVQIFEGTKLKTSFLSEISLPICESDTVLDKADVNIIPFQSTSRVKHDNSGVGSCVDFSANGDGSSITSQPTHGKVFVRVGWGRTSDGTILSPPAEKWSPPKSRIQDPLEDITDVNGRIESAKLDVWMTKNEIDPMDPKNQDLMDRVLEAGKSNVDRPDSNDRNESSNSGSGYAPTLQGGGHFRLDDYHDQFLLGTSSAIENNPRFQMLKLRSSQVAEFKNYRMIPINDKEIPRGIFESLKKPSLGSKQGLLDTEPLRQKFKTYLEQLREEVNHNFAIARHKKRHCDVINEVPLPTSGTMAMLFGEMVPAQRPLKPYRFPRPKIILLDGQDLKILISVVRAFDVPVRNDMDPLQSNPSLQGKNHREESIHGMKENLVRSFVEVRFQGQCQKTPVAPGPNPAWNEEIEFTFKSPNNDFSSDTLNRIKDNLHLHLFDEVAVDMLEDEEERPREVHQRFERKWLGSLAIPFVTMYRNTRIEGTFKLHSPPVLLGYERTGQTSMASGFWRENTDMDQPPKEATYLSIYLTINPPLSNPEPIKEKLECEEDDNLVRHCEKWHRDLMSKFPNRVFSPMVADLTGKSVLVTRYFRAIRPPHDVLENNDQNTEKVAWFVALIPYLPRNALFPGIQAIWPTCEQFIKMMVGSEVEHAVLMTNYFTSLGKKAYLVLGQGIPEGQTAYVLTAEESGQHWLWNVVTGEHFNTSETFCPLVGVTAVANESNVWGNVQSSDAPNRMKWDLTNGSDWTPLFGSHLTLPDLSSVQPTQLLTSQPDQRAATTLKDKIEKKIKSHISSLRKRLKLGTPLNFTVAASLKRLLPALESNRGGIAEGRILATEHLAELKSASAAYKICGFPLHFGYSHMDQIVEALEATGVHLNREPGVEFAVAVHVEPFPQTVMSVWIYVASLVRRR